MEQISNVLFWISGGLLVPVVIGLIFFFIRSIFMLGTFSGNYISRQRREKERAEWLLTVKSNNLDLMAEKTGTLPDSPFRTCIVKMFDNKDDETVITREISLYEVKAAKDLERYKIMIKLGPVLGLMGTLIPMGPALAGLSAGDISTMAYNMQVAFATTVIGLFSAGIAFVLLQIRQRWLYADLVQLDYIADLIVKNNMDKQ